MLFLFITLIILCVAVYFLDDLFITPLLIISSIVFLLFILPLYFLAIATEAQITTHTIPISHQINENKKAITPPINNESIITALAIYQIQIPENVEMPILDLSLNDRGLTSLNGWGKKLQITIGPAAFISWALLGSTLAHELEIHCQQKMIKYRAIEMLGFYNLSKSLAERPAYNHEIKFAQRFGLTNEEVKKISTVRDYFYPDYIQNSLSAKMFMVENKNLDQP